MNYRIFSIAFLVAIAVGVSGAARAALVPFDINPDLPVQPAGVIPGGTLIGSPFTYYNIQYDVDGGGLDLNIRTVRADAPGGPGIDQVVSDGVNSSSILTKGANDYINTPFALGDVIGDGLDEAARLPDQFSVINDGGYQLFSEGSNYLGFRLPSGNYGYVLVNYASASSTYTFTGGVYENTGASLAAGVIPEPGTSFLLILGVVCGLCGTRKGRG